MAEPTILETLSAMTSQLASLNTNYANLSRDVCDIKQMLERQNGRVRDLEVNQAHHEEQIHGLCEDVAHLQGDTRGRDSLVWNGFNTLVSFAATYLALRQ